MTFRKTFWAALALGIVGCAVLPGAGDDLCIGTGDASCTVFQNDASADRVTIDGGFGPDASIAPPIARSSLCTGGCSPDDESACVVDGGDAAVNACRMVLGAGQQTNATCAKAGTGEDGASCTTGADCSAGFECVGTGTCRHYCCDESQCTTMTKNSTQYDTYFCDVASELAASGAQVPVCMIVSHCAPFQADQCQSGEACTIVEINGGQNVEASCAAVGTATLGASCEIDHCAANFACIGVIGERTCQQLCDSQNPCPSNSLDSNCNMKSQALSQFKVGICGPQ